MKVLNLYAGIGGNRKYWEGVAVTAVEMNPTIAAIYKDFFPDDNVVVGDAHRYLLEHFSEFDFIWSSPPCPTHSRLNNCFMKQNGYCYPDMTLYRQIIFLKHWFEGKWCVENVISYYDPLIKPNEMGGHYYWSNFYIKNIANICREHFGSIEALQELKGFDISKYNGINKRKALRNCVEPRVGQIIFECSKKEVQPELFL